MERKYTITSQAKEEYEQERRRLIDIERPQVMQEVAAARALGDLSENADYDAARKRQGEIERRISYLTNVLENCEIIKPNATDNSTVVKGGLVEFKNLNNNKVYKFQIGGSAGANPLSATIPSIAENTPIAIAVLGHKVGDLCNVKAAIEYQVEILSIDNGK